MKIKTTIIVIEELSYDNLDLELHKRIIKDDFGQFLYGQLNVTVDTEVLTEEK